MSEIQFSLLELIRRTSAEIPDDVNQSILASLEQEKKGTIAESALKIIDQNIQLAKRKSQPICQDTGSILFHVNCPVGFDQIEFEEEARAAVNWPQRRAISGRIRWIRSRVSTMARIAVQARRRFIFISIVSQS